MIKLPFDNKRIYQERNNRMLRYIANNELKLFLFEADISARDKPFLIIIHLQSFYLLVLIGPRCPCWIYSEKRNEETDCLKRSQ